MSRARKNEHQCNAKMTNSEKAEFDAVNVKYFGGRKNNSDLARFLFKVAYNALKNSRVNTRVQLRKVTTVSVGGVVIENDVTSSEG